MKAARLGDSGKLVVSIIACLCAGVVGSIFTRQAIPTWYATLTKPVFQSAGLVVCAGLGAAVCAHGDSRIFCLA